MIVTKMISTIIKCIVVLISNKTLMLITLIFSCMAILCLVIASIISIILYILKLNTRITKNILFIILMFYLTILALSVDSEFNILKILSLENLIKWPLGDFIIKDSSYYENLLEFSKNIFYFNKSIIIITLNYIFTKALLEDFFEKHKWVKNNLLKYILKNKNKFINWRFILGILFIVLIILIPLKMIFKWFILELFFTKKSFTSMYLTLIWLLPFSSFVFNLVIKVVQNKLEKEDFYFFNKSVVNSVNLYAIFFIFITILLYNFYDLYEDSYMVILYLITCLLSIGLLFECSMTVSIIAGLFIHYFMTDTVYAETPDLEDDSSESEDQLIEVDEEEILERWHRHVGKMYYDKLTANFTWTSRAPLITSFEKSQTIFASPLIHKIVDYEIANSTPFLINTLNVSIHHEFNVAAILVRENPNLDQLKLFFAIKETSRYISPENNVKWGIHTVKGQANIQNMVTLLRENHGVYLRSNITEHINAGVVTEVKVFVPFNVEWFSTHGQGKDHSARGKGTGWISENIRFLDKYTNPIGKVNSIVPGLKSDNLEETLEKSLHKSYFKANKHIVKQVDEYITKNNITFLEQNYTINRNFVSHIGYELNYNDDAELTLHYVGKSRLDRYDDNRLQRDFREDMIPADMPFFKFYIEGLNVDKVIYNLKSMGVDNEILGRKIFRKMNILSQSHVSLDRGRILLTEIPRLTPLYIDDTKDVYNIFSELELAKESGRDLSQIKSRSLKVAGFGLESEFYNRLQKAKVILTENYNNDYIDPNSSEGEELNSFIEDSFFFDLCNKNEGFEPFNIIFSGDDEWAHKSEIHLMVFKQPLQNFPILLCSSKDNPLKAFADIQENGALNIKTYIDPELREKMVEWIYMKRNEVQMKRCSHGNRYVDAILIDNFTVELLKIGCVCIDSCPGQYNTINAISTLTPRSSKGKLFNIFDPEGQRGLKRGLNEIYKDKWRHSMGNTFTIIEK